MQKIINQIYWDTTNNTYLSGTHLKKRANNQVDFKNALMAPGKTIVKWNSSTDYQMTKEVPRLPMLINRHKYVINIKDRVYPEGTCTYRLCFYNLQGEEVQNLFFKVNEYEFTFPKDAVSYTFELVNTGCMRVVFSRVQIAEKGLPDEIFDDVFYGKKINAKSLDPINLILVADSKRSRKIWPELEESIPNVPLQLINIAWQHEGDLAQELKDWVGVNIETGFRIISSSSRFDPAMEEVKKMFPQISVLTSTEFARNAQKVASYNEVNDWYSKNIYDPDWLLIVQEINDYFRK